MQSMPVALRNGYGDRHGFSLVESDSNTGGQSMRNVPMLHILIRLPSSFVSAFSLRGQKTAWTRGDPIRDNQTRSVVFEDQDIESLSTVENEKDGHVVARAGRTLRHLPHASSALTTSILGQCFSSPPTGILRSNARI